MHFAINTPHFDYMRKIKNEHTREEWHGMDLKKLLSLQWQGRGIRTLLEEILKTSHETKTLGSLLRQ